MTCVKTPPVIKNARGFWFGSFVAAVVVWAAAFVAGGSSATAAPEGKPYACGCYSDGTGACYCGKKTKCGCPGECEPKGCEEKRQKQLEKEIAEETKQAKPLSASQKKELVKLLVADLAEHPEGRSQTITEVRGTLGGE